MRSALLEHLDRSGRADLLLRDERDLLLDVEVRALSTEEQWAYLATQRRIGYWITAVFGAFRLLLLAGGAAAALVFTSRDPSANDNPVVWLMLLVAGIALLWAARTTVALKRRLRDLGRRLPPFSALDLPDDPPPSEPNPPS